MVVSTYMNEPRSSQKPRAQEFMQVMWQRFVVNEKGESDAFSPMERATVLEWHVG